jgi:hypothetical protein
MIRIIRTVAVLLCGFGSATALAQSPSPHQLCKDISILAKKIMEVRQLGAPMAEMMETTKAGDPFDDINKVLVQEAFEVPHYQTEQSQTRAIGDFENEAYRRCYKLRSANGRR